MSKKAGLVWIDAMGERVLHVVTTSAGVGAIETEMQALCNAQVVECWEGLDEIYTVTPSTADYPTTRVTAVLTFADAIGSTAKLYLPAPSSAIFMSDGVTVDPTAISSLITACIGSLVAGSGNTVVSFVGGSAVSTKINAIASLAT